MDYGEVRGLITIITLGTFLAICRWAYRSANRERFERDALLVFDEQSFDERSFDERSFEGQSFEERSSEGQGPHERREGSESER